MQEDGQRTSSTATTGTRTITALYLFAGAHRKSGCADSLHMACKKIGRHAEVTEVDILRGKGNNLMNAKLQNCRFAHLCGRCFASDHSIMNCPQRK